MTSILAELNFFCDLSGAGETLGVSSRDEQSVVCVRCCDERG